MRKLNDFSGFDIVVQNLIEGSPAAESLLESGDVIKKIGNRPVTNQGDLVNAAFFSRPNTFEEFLVLRDDKEIKIPIKVAKRPSLHNELAEFEDPVIDGDIGNISPINKDINETKPF